MITLTQKYTPLPVAGSMASAAVKGRSHHAYWAQTIARNANYLLASRVPPVVASGCGWTETSLGSALLGMPRGRGLLPRPCKSLRAHFKAKYYAGPSGSVTVYAGRTAWQSNNPSSDDVSGSVTVSSSGMAAFEVALSDVPVDDSRLVYVYFVCRCVVIGSWSVVAEAWNG